MFQFEIPFLASSFVLIAAGFVSILFSVSLRRKLRLIERFPEDLSTEVFDRTFNVFDPYPERRKTISSNIELLIFLAVYGPFFFVSYIVLRVVEAGLVLGGVTFIICLGLLMVDDTLEIRKNANAFIIAVRNGTGLGSGDMKTLLVLKKTLPKLSNYYVVLAIMLFGSSLAVPFILDSFLVASAQLASMMFVLATAFEFMPVFALILALFLFVTVIITIQFAAGAIKSKILGFPPPEHIDSLNLARARERMRIFVGIQHHHPKLQAPDPEDSEKSEIAV